MRITLVLVLVVLAAFALPTTSAHGSAFNITVAEACYGDKADVTFSWQGANPGSQQYLDLSLFNNGWRDGTFIGAGPLSGSSASYTWTGLVAGSPHVVRINQLVAGQWDVSGTVAFTPCSRPDGNNVFGCPPGGCLTYPLCPYVIKGNISFNTGEHIYHVPGGAFYNATVINPSQGERWFCSEQEARNAGWRRSSN